MVTYNVLALHLLILQATKDFVMTGDEKKPDDPEAFYYSDFGRSDALAPVPEDGEGGRGDVR